MPSLDPPPITTTTVTGGRTTFARRSGGLRAPSWRRGRWGFLLGFALLYAVLAVPARVEADPARGLLILLAVLGAAVLVVALLDRERPRGALTTLGLGRPAVGAIALATLVSGLLLLVYPLVHELTGADLTLRPGWPWLLLGVFAMHGVAEELVWRGYAFARLRRTRSFRGAVLASMPLIAATHLPVLVTSGVAVGVAAMLVAALTSLTFAHLFELGGRTIWAPAVLHTAIDSFKVVRVPDDAALTFSLVLAAVSIGVPLLALLVPRGGPGNAPAPGRDSLAD